MGGGDIMKHENTRTLFQYWDDLRAGRIAPYRSEVDPRAIAPLLDSTFILEHLRDGATRFRLAGTKFCDSFGMELRGMSALALWQGDCRTRMRSLLNRLVEEPCIGHVACAVETRGGLMFESEFLFLPLRGDTGELNRILGCCYHIGPNARAVVDQQILHHWIDDIVARPIQTEVVDAPPTERPRPAPERAFMQKTISDLERQVREEVSKRGPRLQSIEGGVRGGLAPGVDQSRIDQRARGHLRVVK